MATIQPQLPGQPLDTKELMDFYRLAQDVRKYHHSALWEIEKHFTWWVSIFLGALFLLLVNKDKLDVNIIPWALGLTAVFGLVVSLIGSAVVRREGRYFSEALQICNRAAKALGLDIHPYTAQQRNCAQAPLQPIEFALHPEDYLVRPFNEVKQTANKSYLRLLNVLSARLNVRDYFQLVLAASAVMFTVFLLVALSGVVLNWGPLAVPPAKASQRASSTTTASPCSSTGAH